MVSPEPVSDVLRIDGGLMSIPNINIEFKVGAPKNVTYACFTETMLSTICDIQTHHLGRVDIDFAKSILKKEL